jgi:hypothetical protein
MDTAVPKSNATFDLLLVPGSVSQAGQPTHKMLLARLGHSWFVCTGDAPSTDRALEFWSQEAFCQEQVSTKAHGCHGVQRLACLKHCSMKLMLCTIQECSGMQNCDLSAADYTKLKTWFHCKVFNENSKFCAMMMSSSTTPNTFESAQRCSERCVFSSSNNTENKQTHQSNTNLETFPTSTHPAQVLALVSYASRNPFWTSKKQCIQAQTCI